MNDYGADFQALPGGKGAQPTDYAADFSSLQPAQAAVTQSTPASAVTGTFGENLMAGIGKGMVDIGRGIKQRLDVPAQWLERAVEGRGLNEEITGQHQPSSWIGKFGEAIGLPTAQASARSTQAEVDESARTDAPLNATWGGMIGQGIGQTAAIAPALAAGAAAGIPAAGAMLAPTGYASAIGTGALQGALQPTPTGGNSVVGNTVLGGVGGAAGQFLGNTIGRLGQPVQDAIGAAYQKAVSVLDQAGVPLDAAQRSGSAFLNRLRSSFFDNPFTVGAQQELTGQQKQAFTRAALNTIGEDATAATQDVMGGAQQRINGVFRNVLNRNSVNISDDTLGRIGAIQAQALDEDKPAIARVAQRVVDSVRDDGTVAGQSAYAIKKDLDRLASSNDSTLAYHARQLRSTVMDAINDSLAPQDQAAFAQARGQFANMKKLEGVIGEDGQISPSKLANVFNQRANRSTSVYGQGPQELYDLASAGKMLLPDKLPNSGTTARLAMQVGVPLIAGGGAGVYEGTHNGEVGFDPMAAGKVLALTAGLPKLAQMALNNPASARYLAEGVQYSPLRTMLMAPQENPVVGGIVKRIPISGMLQANGTQ